MSSSETFWEEDNENTHTLEIMPTQWEPNDNDQRIPRMKKEKTKKKMNFGIFFDPTDWKDVEGIFEKIKHLEKKKVAEYTFMFNADDIKHIMDLGRPQKRKRTKSQQCSWIDFAFN